LIAIEKRENQSLIATYTENDREANYSRLNIYNIAFTLAFSTENAKNKERFIQKEIWKKL